jgi:DNA-nicking Smr family endonuclease
MAKQVKKNKYKQEVEASLDLHGLTALEAEAMLDNFLAAASKTGLKRVRIITGKGINSPLGRPVLKPLAETRLKDKGYEFRPAKITEGGEGAIDVDL